ncbi:putative bifunctional diguanylate cyclase/phosphodiesterase [Kushneria indalinina]|nr:EAL domain-containing protein [Kushneria indalinina]
MDAGRLALGLLFWLWSLQQGMKLVLNGCQRSGRQCVASVDGDQLISGFSGVVYCYCPLQQQYCYRANVSASVKGLSHRACQLTIRAFDAMVHPEDRASLQRARRLALHRGYFEHTYRLIHGTSVQRVLDRGIVLRRGGKPECHGLLMDISQLEEVGAAPGDVEKEMEADATVPVTDNEDACGEVSGLGETPFADPFPFAETLRQALAGRQLRLVYQPQVHGHDQRLAGLEALLRWHHPTRGNIPPSCFIPVAESMGLMPTLGNWIIEEACRQISHWRKQGYRVPPVAINVSVLQLDGTLLTHVTGVLDRYGLEGACLEFEITESRLMQNFDECVHVISKLRRQGIRISLDDFGTGYSSLDKLALLPLDRLKLDRSFVTALTSTHHGYHVIEAIVRLAHALRLSVVAEGVETRPQQHLLNELGCEILQGYLFGAGIEADMVIRYLRRDGVFAKIQPLP